MAIYKKIDGKDQIVANKSIVSHEQLSGREAYGAHPISAIRKLPEKLHALKEKDEELSNRITAHDQEVDNEIKRIDQESQRLNQNIIKEIQDRKNEIERVEDNANQIGLKEDKANKGRLLFTDYSGDQISVQGGFLPDEDTISLNENNEMILKKVHTDTDTIIGDGITSNKISAIAIKDTDGIISPKNIRDKHLELDQTIANLTQNTQNEIESIKKLNAEQVDQISDLLTRTQGMGGYLNAYNFGKNVTQDALTQYAIQDIGSITQASQIYNGTKVKNLHNGDIWILTNTPQWTDSEGTVHNPVFSWENQGNDSSVADANNDGVHGLVTGSYEHLEGFIDSVGHISINGLSEEISRLDSTDITLNNNLNKESKTREDADKKLAQDITNLNTYADQTFETITNVNKVKEDLSNITELAVKYKGIYTTGTIYNKHDMVSLDPYYYISQIENNNIAPSVGLNTSQWTCISKDALNAKHIEVTPTNNKVYLVGDISQAETSIRSLYRPATDIYVENGVIYDTRGKLASDIELEELYNKVIDESVKADNNTIIRNEDTTITAIGLYDSNNNITKTAENIIKGTTLVILEEDE